MPRFAVSYQQSVVDRQESRGCGGAAQVIVDILGPVDRIRLRTSWQELIDRHEILRTAFYRAPGGDLLQSPRAACVAEWCEITVDEVNDPLEGIAAREASRPFDLSRPPLARAALVKRGAQHALVLTIHPLCADDITMSALPGEIGQLYSRGRDATADDAPVQYLQYCSFQQQVVAQSDRRRCVDVASPRLPGDTGENRPARRLRASHQVLSSDVIAGLERLASALDIRIEDVLLACWQTLVWRLTGMRAVQIGLLVDGRTHADLSNALGAFAMLVPVSCEVLAHDTLQDLARRAARARATAAAEADHCGWEPSDPPIVFSAIPARHPFVAGDVSFASRWIAAPCGPFTLKLTYLALLQRLELQWDAERLNDASVARLIEQLVTLLERCSENPALPAASIDLVSTGERLQLLEWGESARLSEWRGGVRRQIAERGAAIPDAVALVADDAALTYAAVEAKASELAVRLRARGVRSEVVVGVCLERSPELVVALLAVWQAGGAYLPLEPGDPAARRAWMLEDAGVRLVLSTAALSADLPPHVSMLDVSSPPDPHDAAGRVLTPVRPESLAYVLYTSGSTGRPKGVMITHGGLSNYLNWACRTYEVPSGWGSAVQSPVTFDLTLTSLFTPLLSGGLVDLLSEEAPLEALARSLSRRPGMSLVKITPAHLESLGLALDELGGGAVHVRRFVVGGEALHGSMLRAFRRRTAHLRVVNEYGPTETVVGCCVHEEGLDTLPDGPVQIGRPIANTTAYLLDDRLSLAPTGVAAELYIGGAGVARGYLGRPGLTAERYVPDPYSSEPGARLYRTGDRARWRFDGRLEFVGRTDEQVKIRGCRIEYGEVESVLRECPSVQDAVVIVHPAHGSRRSLVAYVVGQTGELDDEAVRTHVRRRLPAYMVPSQLVKVAALPLTSNGKVDRNALPAPPAAMQTASLQEPSLIERAISDVWGDVLRVEPPQRGQSFFELGGHSLLAVQMLSRVRRMFSTEVSLATFFERPTIAALSAQVKRGLEREGAVSLPPIVATDRRIPLPLSYAQQAMWIECQMTPSSTYNIPAAVRLTGTLHVGALRRAVNEIIRRHQILRTVFTGTPAGPRQSILDTLDLPFEVVDLSAFDEEHRARELRGALERVADTVFDLEKGPLLRVMLCRLRDADHVVLLAMHHIVCDHWSVGVLVQELTALYSAILEELPSPLPDLPVQYADYAVWERGLPPDSLAGKLAYWTAALDGAPLALRLQPDRPRAGRRAHRGDSEPLVLSRETTSRIKAMAIARRTTNYAVLVAVLNSLLYRYTGQEDLVIGTPFANRSTPELSQLIGFFVNLVPIRVRLSADWTFAQLIDHVHGACLGAYAHQEVPFDQLLHSLGLVRSADRVPLVQVVLALLNAPTQTLSLPGLRSERLEVPSRSAAFDLTFGLTEQDGQLVGELNYDTHLFDRTTACRLVAHFTRLADACASDVNTPILAVPLTEHDATVSLPESISRAREFVF